MRLSDIYVTLCANVPCVISCVLSSSTQLPGCERHPNTPAVNFHVCFIFLFIFLHLCMCVYFVASQFVLPVSLCPLGSPVSPSTGHPSLFEVAISPESKPAIKPILALCPFRIFTNGLLWAPRNKNNQNESGPSCAIILCLLLGLHSQCHL